jgi:ribonuclease HI
MEEMERSLAECRRSSPGCDRIHYDMIKNLDQEGRKSLLSLYNKIWIEKTFPDNWRTSLLIPILKKGKDPKKAENYRPISLTNCVCKLFERMINKRLVWHLESKGVINKNQSAFRRKRSTMDNLSFFENEIGKAFKKKEYLISIFFDIHKAYDMVWRFGILKELERIGIKGNMLAFIQNFLSNRKFYTVVGNSFSTLKLSENGIPQGSVLSVTLFLILINTIFRSVKTPVKIVVFADDVLIFMRSRRLKLLERKLQESLNNLSAWSNRYGLSFSPQKTVSMMFRRRRNHINFPQLHLNGQTIRYVDSFKFLGITFDSRLKWDLHIKEIKSKALRKLNILKFLSHHRFGTDRKLLLRIHNLFVLPILDYGSFIYSAAHTMTLKKLDVVHNSGIRLCTGALKTSPVDSLLVDSGQFPLELRRDKQLLMYGFKIKSMIDHPLNRELNEPDSANNRETNYYENFADKFWACIDKYNIAIPHSFNTRRFHQCQPWQNSGFTVDLDLCEFTKKNTSDGVYSSLFLEKREKYRNYKFIFTDGSVKEGRCGAAVLTDHNNFQYRLQDNTSVFTAEIFAIRKAIEIGSEIAQSDLVICSDSKSALVSLKDMYSPHPIVQEIQDSISLSNKTFVFLWVPSHVNIEENEKVDQLAKAALNINETSDTDFIFRDIKALISKKILERWGDHWVQISHNNKLRSIKDNVLPWKNLESLSRKESIVVTRLRIGHTLLTHKYIFEKLPSPCCICGENLTINHIFNSCINYSIRRNQFKIENVKILGSDSISDLRNILSFLKFTDIFKYI